ncbi:MAG: DUF697 domain-containing protein [Actinobacteria bacterium]|nr:MAG: DUF697 domain-containing protein [Actinomycetota bacterium]
MAVWSDVRDIVKAGKSLEAKRSERVAIAVSGPPGVLLERVSDALVPKTSGAGVERIILHEGSPPLPDRPELVIVVLDVVPPSAAAFIEQLARRRVPMLLARPAPGSPLARPGNDALRRLGVPSDDVVDVELEDEQGLEELFERVLKRMPGKRLALTANFEGVRSHAAREIIRHTSWQNALLAGAIFIPGADMPILTANQVKMVLELAAIYGKEMSYDRAKELLAVVGAGFAFRTAARELSGFVPGPGWVLKSAIAYSGTIAVGKAAEQYMQHGHEWQSSVRDRIGRARDKMAEARRSKERPDGD